MTYKEKYRGVGKADLLMEDPRMKALMAEDPVVETATEIGGQPSCQTGQGSSMGTSDVPPMTADEWRTQKDGEWADRLRTRLAILGSRKLLAEETGVTLRQLRRWMSR